MAKFLDNNGVSYLWNKIKEVFVPKEEGKGLSTNDLTDELLQKIENAEGADLTDYLKKSDMEAITDSEIDEILGA